MEMARLSRVGVVVTDAIAMTCPLTSRIRMVTGYRMSMKSPREPAKTASVPLVVGNGDERTASWAERPGTSMMNVIWLTSLLLQRWARRASAGKSLEKVPAMVVTLDGSDLYAPDYARSLWVGSLTAGLGMVASVVDMVEDACTLFC